VKSRGCSGIKDNGQPCQAPKLRERDYCLMHSPEHAAEVAEARRLGGLRRRREVTVAGAYDFAGLESGLTSAASWKLPSWTPWGWRTAWPAPGPWPTWS
jgi:hypothetical protein